MHNWNCAFFTPVKDVCFSIKCFQPEQGIHLCVISFLSVFWAQGCTQWRACFSGRRLVEIMACLHTGLLQLTWGHSRDAKFTWHLSIRTDYRRPQIATSVRSWIGSLFLQNLFSYEQNHPTKSVILKIFLMNKSEKLTQMKINFTVQDWVHFHTKLLISALW